MPDLDFEFYGQEFDEILISKTMAVISFPNDENLRNNFLGTIAGRHLDHLRFKKQDNRETKKSKSIEDLINMQFEYLLLKSGGHASMIDSPGVLLKEKLLAQGRKGLTAGRILLYVHSIEKWQQGEGSINKACYLVEKYWAPKQGLSLEIRTIQKSWKEMKDVAPFWVANGFYGPLEEKMKFNSFKNFLSTAEDIRKRSENFKTPRSSVNLLSSKKTWKVPQNISLPKANYSIPNITKEEEKILYSYKAPSRSSMI